MSKGKGLSPTDTERWVEALSWHGTLTEDDEALLTSSVIRDWQHWYADPENQRLFDHVSRLAEDCQLYRQRQPSSSAMSALEDYDPAIPVAEWRQRTSSVCVGSRPGYARNKWRFWLIGGLGFAATVATVVMLILSPLSRLGAVQIGGAVTYETEIGGLKSILLKDGSDVTLGGKTKLSVAFSRDVRFVQLIRGEAWFKVAHNPKWPFLVHAGNRVIRAVGTAFVVARDSDRVVVTVTEGTVAISAPPIVSSLSALDRGSDLPKAPGIRVTRGEAVTYRDNGMLVPAVKTDPRAAMAWTRGRLIFDDEPLRYVIGSVNRYFPHPICATRAAGSLRFSGVIFSSEIEDWLQGLPRIFPVEVEARGAAICVHMRAAAGVTVPCNGASQPQR